MEDHRGNWRIVWPAGGEASLSAGVRRGMEAARGVDLEALSTGRHELDGTRIVAIVDEYVTRPAGQCPLEAHRRHHDIQIILSGRERIGLAPLAGLKVVQAYDEERDVMFLESPAAMGCIELGAGEAAIFTPDDAHAPQMRLEGTGGQRVRKVVVKVAVQ